MVKAKTRTHVQLYWSAFEKSVPTFLRWLTIADREMVGFVDIPRSTA